LFLWFKYTPKSVSGTLFGVEGIIISRVIAFIETPIFTKQSDSLFTDDEIRKLQSELIQNLKLDALIKEAGGLRKVRIATRKTSMCRTIFDDFGAIAMCHSSFGDFWSD